MNLFDNLTTCFFTFKMADEGGTFYLYDALFSVEAAADSGDGDAAENPDTLYLVYADAEGSDGTAGVAPQAPACARIVGDGLYASVVTDRKAFDAAVAAEESGSPKARVLKLGQIESEAGLAAVRAAVEEVESEDDPAED